MNTRECTAILRNGRKCGCAASKNQAFCRHHGAHSRPRIDAVSRPVFWRKFGATLSRIEPPFIPDAIQFILDALLHDNENGISDRVAGRILRTLVRSLDAPPSPSTRPQRESTRSRVVSQIAAAYPDGGPS
jgi:hypothetical protein